MAAHPKVAYTFQQVEPKVQEQIKDLVQKNIEGKMDSYFKKIYKNKPTAEVRIDYRISFNKKGKYEACFIFDFDGKHFVYESKVAFKFPEDLVNHAFKHFKEFLSKQL